MSKKHGTAFPFMVSVFVTLLPAASLRVSVTVSVPGLPEVSAPTPHRLPPTAGGEAAERGCFPAPLGSGLRLAQAGRRRGWRRVFFKEWPL